MYTYIQAPTKHLCLHICSTQKHTHEYTRTHSRTHRYWMFVPIALSSTESDAYSLSEIQFFFKGRKVNASDLVPYSYAESPVDESPLSLIDGDTASKFTGMDNCPVLFDFGRPVSVDTYRITTSNDCNSRDPVRWMLLASPDEKNWVLVDDQSQASYPTPVERGVSGPDLTIDAMLASDLSENATVIHADLTESSWVPYALNTITLNMTLGKRGSARQASPITPPVGMTFIVADFMGSLTPSGDLLVNSEYMCSLGKCTPLMVEEGYWKNEGMGRGVGSIVVNVSQCTVNTRIIFSWQVRNPPANNSGSQPVIYGFGGIYLNAYRMSLPVLRSNGSAAIVGMRVEESSRIELAPNNISAVIETNLPAMRGSIFTISGMQTSASLDSDSLPVTVTYEDGYVSINKGVWHKDTGKLTFALSDSARRQCKSDGTCTPGHTFTASFSLLNGGGALPPVTPNVSAIICVDVPCRPQMDVGMFTRATGSILGSGEKYPGKVDVCGECGGDGSMCCACESVRK